MNMKQNNKSQGLKSRFDRFSKKVTKATGSPYAFLIALIVVLLWALSGPVFGFSDTWQLVINTGTTIITFLMVFVIQQSQNKDTVALQLKLNELLAAEHRASNRLIDIEDLTEEELDKIKRFYTRLAELSAKDSETLEKHTEEEARQNHLQKIKQQKSDVKK